MRGAILEVLLVSAKGIDHNRFVGDPDYHVIIECGTQICRSKTSSGGLDKVYWNEKFIFKLPESEKTSSHIKLKIVKEGHFTDGKLVGETIIFLKRIIMEGNYKGLIELKPAPFNVVLEDDTYKGQIMVGLKLIPNIVIEIERKEYAQEVQEGNDVGESICKLMTSMWKMQWWRLFSSYREMKVLDKLKEN